MANEYLDVYVSCPSYISKYCRKTFENGIIKVTAKHDLGLWICGMLKTEPDDSFESLSSEQIGNEHLTLRLSRFYPRATNYGNFLHAPAKKLIVKKVKHMFRTDLRHFVRKTHMECGTPEKYLLRQFFNFYGITEDDFQEDSMYRDYSRWKESKKIIEE